MRQIELEVVDFTTDKDKLHIEYFTKRDENQEEENSGIRQAFAKAGYDIESAAQTLLSYYE